MIDKIFDTPKLTRHDCVEQGIDRFDVGKFETDLFGDPRWFVCKKHGREFIHPIFSCPFCGTKLE